ncbi:MAG: uroporphyrinogen decarboxylase family protein [Saccharofermentanales bacterium]
MDANTNEPVMNESTKIKLDRIYTLYTPERLQKSKERFIMMDKGQKPVDRYPFCIGFPYFNAYNINHPPKERLEAFLDAFLFMWQFDDDTIPYVFPGLNHATMPSMFGAKEIKCGIESTSEKMIKSADDIFRLPEPSVSKDSAAYKWIEMAEYIKRETGGRIPVNVCDMQGPFDACAQIWSYDEMFISAYENPEAFHHIISKMTDAFIMLWKMQKDILGETFLGTHLFSQGWVPQDCGVAVSADSLVMISPDFYDEFYKPYLIRMYEALGDLTIHSCGDFRHLIKNLCETPGLKAINASQLNVRQMNEAGLDPKIQMLLAMNYDDVESEMKYVKDNSLNVRWAVYGVTPTDPEKSENPLSWTEEDFDVIHKRIEIIKDLMKV